MSGNVHRLPTFREDERAGHAASATSSQLLSPERAYKETKKA